jgi:hypothetical protein
MDKVRIVDGLIPTVDDFNALQDSSINHTNNLLLALMDVDSSMQSLLPGQIPSINYGILDSDTMFLVSINSIENTKIDVTGTDARGNVGYTRILERAYLAVDSTAITLSDYNVGVINYVCAKVSVITSAPQGITIHGTIENKRYVNTTEIVVYSQSEFSALTDNELDVIIVLATVTANGVGVALTEQAIDLSQDYYIENRLQFSIRNHFHEKKIGSGVITTKNIHGLALSDLLSVEDLSLLPNLFFENRKGVYFGDFVQESVATYARDLTGVITGFVNNWYIELNHFPKHLVYVSINSAEIPASIVPQTKILDLGTVEPTATPIVVHYLYYNICEPKINSGTLEFNVPFSNEYYMVNGSFMSSLEQNTLLFVDSPAYDIDYDVILTKDKKFIKKPYTLISKVDVDNAAIYDGLNLVFEQCRIRLYPENVVSGNLAVISVFGKDINANDVIENFEITANQPYDSIQYFAAISKVTITASTIAPNAKLSILTISRYDQTNDLLAATVKRTSGGSLTTLIDRRPFFKTLTDPSTLASAEIKNQQAEDYFRRNDVMKYFFHENFYDTQGTDFIRSKVYPKNGMISGGYWVSGQCQTPETFSYIKISLAKEGTPKVYSSVDDGDTWIEIISANWDLIIATTTSAINQIRFKIDCVNSSKVSSFIALMYKQYTVNYTTNEIRVF